MMTERRNDETTIDALYSYVIHNAGARDATKTTLQL